MKLGDNYHLPNCRFCDKKLSYVFCDLGTSPLSNSFLTQQKLYEMEPYYPLCAYVCSNCFLVQLPEVKSPELIFEEYAYFSSYSETWLEHIKRYTDKMIDRFNIGDTDLVMEIASNDGYLLKYFKERMIPVLGIDPAKNVATLARKNGIPTVEKFFGFDTAKILKSQQKTASLLVGNNVLAHVPDINDFVTGMKFILKSDGILTMEFPHLLELIKHNQFDTIYHEHFSYLSFTTVRKIFRKHGLEIFDVETIPTHGGSLRIYGKHIENESYPSDLSVLLMEKIEQENGLNDISTYSQFSERVYYSKRKILEFLISVKNDGKSIVAYGAPAKGNTLLNFCGIRTDFLPYTVDRSEYKQNLFLPGTHIPIFSPEVIITTRPDYVVILPWNIKEEIIVQLNFIRSWGGKFVVLMPKVEVIL